MSEYAMKGLSHRAKAGKPAKHEDKRKHGYAETRIKHHPNGSHTVEHHKIGQAADPHAYAAQDMDAMHDGLEEHLNGKPTAAEMGEK